MIMAISQTTSLEYQPLIPLSKWKFFKFSTLPWTKVDNLHSRCCSSSTMFWISLFLRLWLQELPTLMYLQQLAVHRIILRLIIS